MVIENQRKNEVGIPLERIKTGKGGLILELCEALNQFGVRYCHWKSNANIEKTLSGEGDLDVLVHRQDIQVFNHILMSLGFKEAEVPDGRRIPGIRDYFGYDPQLPAFVHIHAHFQLTVGHDATKGFHLPIEDEYLKSSRLAGPIRVPACEFEYILLIIRMVFKHLTWDAFLRMESRFKHNELFEYEWLKKQASPEKVNEILAAFLPMINVVDFHHCEKILAARKIGIAQIQTGEKLVNQLMVFSRLNPIQSQWRKFNYRLSEAFRGRIMKKRSGKTLTSGGIFIAVVGGDGSGKTTLIRSLCPWLGQVFEIMQVHLGKPHWSLLTILVRSFLKMVRLISAQPFLEAPLIYTNDQEKIKFPGYPWAIREVYTARDRYLTYRKALRFATNGGIVISDRFPLPGIHFMDGPQIERMYGSGKKGWWIQWLIRQEKKYYRYVRRPDLMIVLRVDPRIAAQRKGEEDKESVVARSNEIWVHNWDLPNTHIIDASLPPEDVLGKVKALIWSYL